MNPNDTRDISRLRRAVEFSQEKLRPFREKRVELLRELAGKHYGDGGTSMRVPVNMMELAMSIYMVNLVASAPRASVSTDVKHLRPGAWELELAINNTVKKIQLEMAMQTCVMEAITGMGIMKVCPAATEVWDVAGDLIADTPIIADSVSLDDWVHDVAAKRWDHMAFRGHRIRIPYSQAKENPLYDKKARDKLKPTMKYSDSAGSDDESAADMSTHWTADSDEIEPQVELWEIELPYVGVVITLPDRECGDRPLFVREWGGPEGGMFLPLIFTPMPDNVMPLAPAYVWLDLHQLINGMYNSLATQATNQKTVIGVDPSSAEDANRIRNAADMEMIKLTNPAGVREMKFNGPDQSTLAFGIHAKQLASYMWGNLDALGGLGLSGADTLGQSELLSQSASRRMAWMQKRTEMFAQHVLEHIGYWLWNDPLIDMPIVKKIRGTDIAIASRFAPETREGDLADYGIRIEPYSMQFRTPGEKLAAMQQILQTFIIPFIGQSNAQLDVDSLIKTAAKLANIEEMDEWLTTTEVTPSQVGGGGEEEESAPKPPVTNRTYTRVNKPGRSQQSSESAMVAHLMNQNQQPSERARITA